jgi:hypothetical protein
MPTETGMPLIIFLAMLCAAMLEPLGRQRGRSLYGL